MNITREEFERYFRKLQASWGYDGMMLNPEEAEQLRRVAMGEISRYEYDRWLLDRIKKGGIIETERENLLWEEECLLLNNKVEEFYDKLPLVNEPLTESEKEQLRDNTNWISLEEIEKEPGEK